MLDSTGYDHVKIVRCAFCPDKADVPVYEPKVGHCGEALKDHGPYIWNVYNTKDKEEVERLFAGKFYVVTFDAGKFSLDQHHLLYEGGYAYDHRTLPPLEFKDIRSREDGRLFIFFWVCEHCAQILGDDLKSIQHVWAQKISWHAEIEQRAEQIKEAHDHLAVVK